jgi:hypothetical protein
MLTDEEKSRIRLDETYREEIRRSLAVPATKTGTERVLSILNAPFMLWLLSSVVVGLAGFFYGQWQTTSAAKAKRAETIHRIDIEMSGRVGLADYAVLVLQSKAAKGELLVTRGQTAAVIADALDGIESGHPIVVALDEYKGRSVASLLIELRGLVPPDERQALLVAIEVYRNLQVYRQTEPIPGPTDADSEQAHSPAPVASKAAIDGIYKPEFYSYYHLKRWPFD